MHTEAIQTRIPIEIFYREYDNILLGTRSAGSTLLMSKKQGSKITDEVLKYVFDYYLGMAPHEVRDFLTPDLLKSMKIAPFTKRIPCPEELDEHRDVLYIAYHLYPETKNIGVADLVRKVYFEVVNGKRDKFPRLFFDAAGGWARAKICLMAMIGEYLVFTGVDEMYAFFADEKRARDFLAKKRLSMPLKDMFTTPLEYLHESLPAHQRSDYFYAMYTDPDFDPEDYQEYWDRLPAPGKEDIS
jgi:hypothetical protein